MSALTLPSFEVKGFRAFKDLRIERLGRVNLVVGKNNVGKTSLLEALQLYAEQGYPPRIWELLSERDQVTRSRAFRSADTVELLSALRQLFHDRPSGIRATSVLWLGPIGMPDAKLTISLIWVPRRPLDDPWNKVEDYLTNPGEPGNRDDSSGDETPGLSIQIGQHHSILYSLERISPNRFARSDSKVMTCRFVGANGLTKAQVGELWDNIALTDVQRDVIQSLKIIAPGVEGLSLVAEARGDVRDRIPIVRIAGMNEPIPLRSLGDGMQRMLGIALALVNAKDGILLVDEVENGLHYTILPQLWRLIFETARQLNVQVFATSHSWECLEAFQRAAEEDTESEGLLIRLQLKGKQIIPVLIGENDLGIATRQEIEVR